MPSSGVVTKTIFPVADVAASAGFYRSLGFEVESYDDGYAWVRHQGEEVLHLAKADGLTPETNHAAVYFHVAQADVWHAAFSEALADLGEVVDRPWGMRQFELTDPDGNLLRVGNNL